MKSINLLFFGVFFHFMAFGQVTLSDYLDTSSLDPDIPTPREVLGYEIGDFHVSHDQMIRYLEKLVKASDRIEWTEYARSYEQRPLVYLTVTVPENHKRIEAIKANQNRLNSLYDIDDYDSSLPKVIYQGYSIHGNEASGGNAALLYAYMLAATTDSDILDILRQTVVLIDPCYNPDGFNRFASWVNVHRSDQRNPDPANREFNEVWPGGRTNHYWYDLNRDWLLVQHPESRGRIKSFHEWKPVILTDHHEMGTNRSFFFQPGIPSRTNPLTPSENQDMTGQIARYHEKQLDEIKSLYYSQESFDDFYIGKGSTYPDVNGCIGILFEQASSRGHNQESKYGTKSFPFTIKNQLMTSISTLLAAGGLHRELRDYQVNFFKEVKNASQSLKKTGYHLTSDGDAALFMDFLDILDHHRITYDHWVEDRRHQAYIPLAQAQHTLIQGLLEERTQFQDSLFYDVSAWNIAHAFNLQYRKTSSPQIQVRDNQPLPPLEKAAYAYSFSLESSASYPMVLDLLESDILCLLSHKDFKGEKMVRRASVIVPLENQKLEDDEIYAILRQAQMKYDLDIQSHQSGAKESGAHLGSPSHDVLSNPEVALIVGNGVRSYNAGEVWHLFDQRLSHPITLLDIESVNTAKLERYNTLILSGGSYSKTMVKSIQDWAGSGKKLIALHTAVSWLAQNNLINLDVEKSWQGDQSDAPRPYEKISADRGARYIGGTVFETRLDLTHPLNYGYTDDSLPVFKRGVARADELDNVYAGASYFTQDPLLAGYCPKGFEKSLAGRPALFTSKIGSMPVICFMENPIFRAYFRGAERQLMNAVLFGESLSWRSLE